LAENPLKSVFEKHYYSFIFARHPNLNKVSLNCFMLHFEPSVPPILLAVPRTEPHEKMRKEFFCDLLFTLKLKNSALYNDANTKIYYE